MPLAGGVVSGWSPGLEIVAKSDGENLTLPSLLEPLPPHLDPQGTSNPVLSSLQYLTVGFHGFQNVCRFLSDRSDLN